MSGTILVVDDNAENRALALATLEDEGYRVVLASGGVAGVEAFAREQPDCILLDVRMPDLDGLQACQQIRALPGGAEVPIVFVTAQRDLETFDRASHSGGDDFMTKPFRPNELVVRVDAALKLRRLATERVELYALVKQQRDQLQRLQLEREQLVSFLVHDLKNPVNAIGLHAELVLRDRNGTERSRGAAARIQDEGRSLLRMITALLDIARADEGRLAPARERLDLPVLVGEVVEAFRIQAQAVGVELHQEVHTPTLDGDPDLVRRVIENLLENAIRHAPEGTVVRVTATSAQGGVELAVRDAGLGVPADQRDTVFDRFVQAAPSTRGNRGLGLTFCKLAIEAHGGRIWIEDGSPGATFIMWIAHAN